jgi:hypothetical protein
VYGLNGIVNRQPAPQHAREPVDSVISFDELLRMQQELDRSIAALRLFSAEDDTRPETKLRDIIPLNSSSTDQSVRSVPPKHESGRSDFSLSHFPEPPMVSTLPPSPSSLGSFRARQKQSRNLREDDGPTVPVINIPKVNGDMTREPNVESTLPVVSGAQRLDSAGTQYDVTSFIGGKCRLDMIDQF